MPITLEQGTIVAMVSAIIVGVGMMQNVRERLQRHEELFAENEKAHAAILASNAEDHREIKEGVQYIRERVDRAINGKVRSLVVPPGPSVG